MKKPDLPKNEKRRLQELNSYNILGEVEQESFDFLTRMAAEICDAKISLISLVTEDKQWFLSHHGLEVRETPKDYSFCAHAINNPTEPFIVEDSREDERFQDNPLVTGRPNVIFYAGIPLVNQNDAALGSICVIDETPRTISESQLESLRLLADQTINLLELRRKTEKLQEKENDLNKKEELLRTIQSMNDIGTWELDIETGETYWSEEVYNIHEVPKDFDHNKSNGVDFFHPDDRSRISKALENTIEHGEPFEVTARFITAKDNLRWVRCTGRLLKKKGYRKSILGSFQDITNLKESEQKFQGIFNSTFSFIGFLSPDGTLLEINDTALEMAGITREDVIDKKFWDGYWWQISETVQKDLKENIQKALRGEEVSYEVEVWVKDETPITILFSLRPIFDARGMVRYIISEGRPIQEVVEVRNKYLAVIEGTQAGTYEWNIETDEVFTNDRYAEMLGYTPEELNPGNIETWRQNAHPEDLKKSHELITKCFNKEVDYYELEMRLKHKSGHWVWVNVRGKIFEWTSDGRPLKMYGTHQEITKRKKAEEVREELLIRFEHIGHQIPGVIYQYKLLPDGSSFFPYASSGIEDIYGVTPEQVKQDSTSAFKAIHPDDFEKVSTSISESAENMTSWQDTYRVNLPSGDTIWVEGNAAPQEQDDGSILWHGYIQDISERKRKEEALRVSEEAFRGNFENAAIGMALLDESGSWQKVNRRMCEIVGYSEKELMDLTFQDITHPEDLDSDLEYLNEVIAGKREHYQMEKRYFHKNGQIVHIILAVSVARDSEGEVLYFISQIIDITAKKEAERRLNEALSSLQAIFDASTQVSIITTDTQGTITQFNKGAEMMLGYRAEEVVGKQTPQLIHLEEEIEQRAKELTEELGKPVRGFDVFVEEAKQGKAVTKQWTYKRKNGSTYPVLLSVTAIKRENETSGFLGVATDITPLEKAKKELRLLLNISEKQNERLKNFAHIVTHNLRSHSGGIYGMLDLIEDEYPDIFANEYVQLLKSAGINLKETIENLTNIVKQGFVEEDELQEVNLKKVVESNISSAVTIVNENKMDIINKIDENIKLRVIPAYLDSIIMNFLTNAIKYSSPDRDSYVKIHTKKSEDFVQLIFEDNGIGIDLNEHGDELFGMYNTFHDNEDSRGVGLFITKNQIESLGGHVEVESEVNKGTSFKVFLPNSKD